MNRTHHRSSLPVSDDFSIPVTLPSARGFAVSPYKTVSGKLTRFLARNVATKKMTMRNARPLISFTFDDAAASACSIGTALLEQYQARGTFYISGGKCGAVSPTGRLATTDQLKSLHTRGHEIGCHTYSHTRVSGITRDALTVELDRNRTFLQGALGDIPIRNFAYPYGDISFGTKRFLDDRFDSCRAITPGVNAGVADLGVLKSCALEQTSIDRQHILELIEETVRCNGWLLFAAHDVDNEPSCYGVQPDLLEFALRSAAEPGCQLVSVAHALRILNGTTHGEQTT
jgi:peptidoglycan/xylan/chitin deacetylase (PgdA/CDA1 family)